MKELFEHQYFFDDIFGKVFLSRLWFWKHSNALLLSEYDLPWGFFFRRGLAFLRK